MVEESTQVAKQVATMALDEEVFEKEIEKNLPRMNMQLMMV